MTTTMMNLYTESLKLPDSERAELASRILESLEGPPDDYAHMNDAEFESEIRRRRDELFLHPERAIPWEEAKLMMKLDEE